MKPERWTKQMLEENVKRGYWDTPLICQWLDIDANLYPEKEALVDSRVRLTWAQAKLWMDRMALAMIKMGIKRDEAIIIQQANNVDQWVMRWACEKAGIVHLPMRRGMGLKETEHLLNTIKAVAIVIPWKFRDRDHFAEIQSIKKNVPTLRYIIVNADQVPEGAFSLRQMEEDAIEAENPYYEDMLAQRRFKPTEVSWMAHTTGTTGLPKAGRYLAANRSAQGIGIISSTRLTHNDIIGLVSPAPAGTNSAAYWAAPMTGSKVAMLEDYEPEGVLKLIEKEKVTFLMGSPALLITAVRHPNFNKYDHSSMRIITSAGAPLALAIGEEIEAKMGCPIINVYGSMDAGITFYTGPEDPLVKRVVTCGKPISWASFRILDPDRKPVPPGGIGEVEVTGPAAGDGYVGNPEANKESWTPDGWYKTGDLGKVDEEGNLMIVGRSKNVIIRGGDKVAPGEVESSIIKNPKISDVAVVGMPDEVMGQRVCAFVVPRPGQTITLDELVPFLKKAGLTPYKIPERLEIVNEIPRAGQEKIDVKLLVAQITEKLKAEGKKV